MGRFQLRIFHSTLHFFQLLWICLLLPRFLQLSGQPDPSLSLKRCPFIPKSSHFASQEISLGGGGLKMRILDVSLSPLCCRSGMPGHLGKVEQVEVMWKKQNHSSLTPVLWENQPWEQQGSSAGVIWEPKRMDKDPAASITNTAPGPSSHSQARVDRAESTSRDMQPLGTSELILLHPLGWAALGLGFSGALLHRLGLQHPKVSEFMGL